MTIIVAGEIKVAPEAVQDMVPILTPFVAATRAEAGCIAYGFYEDVTEPGTFRLYEEWADEAALDAHMAAPHMAEFQNAIAAHPPQSVDVKFFRAEQFVRG